jgi:hypothetical protein
MTERVGDDHWHLDRKVPITIILAMIFQTALAIYIGTTWKTEVDFRLANLERQNNERQSQEARIITVEQQLRYIVQSLQRIENRLEGNRNGTQEN